MLWTEHAKRRAAERFPGLDLEAIFNFRRTKPADRKFRRRWREATGREWAGFQKYLKRKGCNLMVYARKIIFVVGPNELIITVYPMPKPPSSPTPEP